MVLTVSANTYAALQNAGTKGIVPRDFVWFKGRNVNTNALETVGIWSGPVAITIDVIRPDTGAIVSRTYQPGAGLMEVPSIPFSMSFEETRISLMFSDLTPAIINAVRVYKVKNQPIEIHRALFDPETMRPVDPAYCRFDGLVRRAPFKRPKVGNDGKVRVEAVGHSSTLMPNPEKLSDEFFQRRDGDGGGRYLAATPKVVWGQEIVVHEKKKKPKEKFWG